MSSKILFVTKDANEARMFIKEGKKERKERKKRGFDSKCKCKR